MSVKWAAPVLLGGSAGSYGVGGYTPPALGVGLALQQSLEGGKVGSQ